jgi:hypothetical protein
MNTRLKPLKSYSMFSGWTYHRLSPTQVRLWNTCSCYECTYKTDAVENLLAPKLLLNDITIFEDNDACLNLSHLKPALAPPPNERAVIPYAGGPIYCPFHYDRWLKGRVLPSQEIIA